MLDNRTPTLNITGPQGNDAMGIDAAALQEVWGRTAGRKSTKVRRLTDRRGAQAARGRGGRQAPRRRPRSRPRRSTAPRTTASCSSTRSTRWSAAASGDGPDVSREGVQRDLLSVVEGCDVYTRYGHVRTDHILFVAAGAFHFHKPSELIPELQGRFPVRVALTPLTEADFVRILQEPRNSLVRQYEALFGTENVKLRFADDGLQRLAHLAFRQNETLQNIGARRLFTILEMCLEELSFEATDRSGDEIVVDRALVDAKLGDTADDPDLIKYNL